MSKSGNNSTSDGMTAKEEILKEIEKSGKKELIDIAKKIIEWDTVSTTEALGSETFRKYAEQINKLGRVKCCKKFLLKKTSEENFLSEQALIKVLGGLEAHLSEPNVHQPALPEIDILGEGYKKHNELAREAFAEEAKVRYQRDEELARLEAAKEAEAAGDRQNGASGGNGLLTDQDEEDEIAEGAAARLQRQQDAQQRQQEELQRHQERMGNYEERRRRIFLQPEQGNFNFQSNGRLTKADAFQNGRIAKMRKVAIQNQTDDSVESNVFDDWGGAAEGIDPAQLGGLKEHIKQFWDNIPPQYQPLVIHQLTGGDSAQATGQQQTVQPSLSSDPLARAVPRHRNPDPTSFGQPVVFRQDPATVEMVDKLYHDMNIQMQQVTHLMNAVGTTATVPTRTGMVGFGVPSAIGTTIAQVPSLATRQQSLQSGTNVAISQPTPARTSTLAASSAATPASLTQTQATGTAAASAPLALYNSAGRNNFGMQVPNPLLPSNAAPQLDATLQAMQGHVDDNGTVQLIGPQDAQPYPQVLRQDLTATLVDGGDRHWNPYGLPTAALFESHRELAQIPPKSGFLNRAHMSADASVNGMMRPLNKYSTETANRNYADYLEELRVHMVQLDTHPQVWTSTFIMNLEGSAKAHASNLRSQHRFISFERLARLLGDHICPMPDPLYVRTAIRNLEWDGKAASLDSLALKITELHRLQSPGAHGHWSVARSAATTFLELMPSPWRKEIRDSSQFANIEHYLCKAKKMFSETEANYYEGLYRDATALARNTLTKKNEFRVDVVRGEHADNLPRNITELVNKQRQRGAMSTTTNARAGRQTQSTAISSNQANRQQRQPSASRTQSAKKSVTFAPATTTTTKVVEPSRTRSPSPNPTLTATSSPFNGNCNNCQEYGHRARDCPKPRRAAQRQISQDSAEAEPQEPFDEDDTDYQSENGQSGDEDGAFIEDDADIDSDDTLPGDYSDTEEVSNRHVIVNLKRVKHATPNLVGPVLRAPVLIENIPVSAVMDSGCGVNTINNVTATKIANSKPDPQAWWNSRQPISCEIVLRDVQGKVINAPDCFKCEIEVGGRKLIAPFVLHPDGKDGMLLGSALMAQLGTVLHFAGTQMAWGLFGNLITQPVLPTKKPSTVDTTAYHAEPNHVTSPLPPREVQQAVEMAHDHLKTGKKPTFSEATETFAQSKKDETKRRAQSKLTSTGTSATASSPTDRHISQSGQSAPARTHQVETTRSPSATRHRSKSSASGRSDTDQKRNNSTSRAENSGKATMSRKDKSPSPQVNKTKSTTKREHKVLKPQPVKRYSSPSAATRPTSRDVTPRPSAQPTTTQADGLSRPKTTTADALSQTALKSTAAATNNQASKATSRPTSSTATSTASSSASPKVTTDKMTTRSASKPSNPEPRAVGNKNRIRSCTTVQPTMGVYNKRSL